MSEDQKPERGRLEVLSMPMSEADYAADLKKRFADAMTGALAIMDESMSKGLLLQFDGIPINYGKHQIVGLRVVKILS